MTDDSGITPALPPLDTEEDNKKREPQPKPQNASSCAAHPAAPEWRARRAEKLRRRIQR